MNLKNAVYEVVQELFCQRKNNTESGFLKEERTRLKYTDENQVKKLFVFHCSNL